MTDNRAREFAVAAHSAGLAIGLYHMFDPSEDPLRQAQHFAEVSRALGATLPPMADFEPTRLNQIIDDGYANRSYAFIMKLQSIVGVRPIVYSARYFADQHLDYRFGTFPLFLSDYSAAAHRGKPRLPKWWTELAFWDLATGVENDSIMRDMELVAYKGDIGGAFRRPKFVQ